MVKKSAEQESEVRKNMRGGEGEVTIKHYFRQNQMSASCRLCAQLIIPPGSGIGPHDHNNEDEVFIIQQGKARVIDEGKETDVEAGDAILTGKGASHAIKNIGEENLVVTAVIIQYG